jgi:prevent-host-death family protein
MLQEKLRCFMETTTFSGRDFNQYSSEARRAANKGPVFITDRGRPAHVLMSIELYKRLIGSKENIADLLAMPGDTDVDFEISPLSRELARAADLS